MNTATLTLGTCCACGGDADVVNLVCLDKRSPYGCDDCLAAEVQPREFVKGEIAKGERAPFEELADAEPWQHDPANHPDIDLDCGDAEGVILWSLVSAIVDRVAQMNPVDIPPYWRNEVSGKLQPAIEALINWGGKPGGSYPPPTPEQLGLIIQYFQMYVNAPCWRDDHNLAELRAQAQTLAIAEDCDRWLMAALDLGIDPL